MQFHLIIPHVYTFAYSVKIVKVGSDTPCWYYNKETDWGCVHDGDAYVYYTYYDDANEEESETVSITDVAGGTFYFYIDSFHNYEKEYYYEYDHNIESSLELTIGGESFGPFHPPYNYYDNFDEYDYGYINPQYDGNTLVTVTCDNECVCTVEQTENQCEIKAVLDFPSIEDAPYYGYHND